MDGGRPGETPTKALLASSASPQEQGIRTKKPEVVQGLHDGCAGGAGTVIGSRRNQREYVVEMDNRNLRFPHRVVNRFGGTAVPEGVGQHSPGSLAVNGRVVQRKTFDDVPTAFQQVRLVGEDAVLAAGLLIEVVNHHYVHF